MSVQPLGVVPGGLQEEIRVMEITLDLGMMMRRVMVMLQVIQELMIKVIQQVIR